MPMKPDQIVRPRTLEEASAWVEKLGDSAGLLWLGPRVEPPESWARESMIDLSELELDYIKAGDNEVAIPGKLTPLCSNRRPPSITRHRTHSPDTSITSIRIFPSSRRRTSPGLTSCVSPG